MTRGNAAAPRHRKKTLPGKFVRKQHISAQARERREENEDTTVTEADERTADITQLDQAGGRGVRRARARMGAANWTGLGVLMLVYFWQFVFALLSLIGFGLLALTLGFAEGNFVGQTISFFQNTFGVSVLPTESLGYIGFGFWALATLLAISVFVVYLLWYRIQGINPFDRVTAFFVTVILLSLSMLPITNLFPWAILWVLYINTTSLFLRNPE